MVHCCGRCIVSAVIERYSHQQLQWQFLQCQSMQYSQCQCSPISRTNAFSRHLSSLLSHSIQEVLAAQADNASFILFNGHQFATQLLIKQMGSDERWRTETTSYTVIAVSTLSRRSTSVSASLPFPLSLPFIHSLSLSLSSDEQSSYPDVCLYLWNPLSRIHSLSSCSYLTTLVSSQSGISLVTSSILAFIGQEEEHGPASNNRRVTKNRTQICRYF